MAEPLHVSTDSNIEADIDRMLASQRVITQELRKQITGQDEIVEQVLICLYVGGHSLITGLPGLAKTLLVRSIARTLGLSFKRIQFTPDLMPADITGTEIIEEDRTTGKRVLEFVRGPIFANLILADEINRTPPKTQAALLEAMQERRVTVRGETHELQPPFFVFATQNPIELEGTYPLPEAQLDRFMFNVVIGYLSENDEIEVVTRTTGEEPEEIQQVVSQDELLQYQGVVRKIPASKDVVQYAVRLTRATRPGDPLAPSYVNDWVSYGASLRASQYLILSGKARALIKGRFNVSIEDIQKLALPVLRHRILTNFHAESENIQSSDIIERLVKDLKPLQSQL